MRGLGQYLTRRVLGYLVILAVGAVLSFAGMGRAHAQAMGSQEAAAQACLAWAATTNQNAATNSWWYICHGNAPTPTNYETCGVPFAAGRTGPTGIQPNGNNCYQSGAGPWTWATACPAGINNATGECNPDNAQCLALNSQEGFAGVGTVTKTFTSKCIAGCNYAMVGGGVATTSPNGTGVVAVGKFEWTGTCANPVPVETVETAKVNKPQECIQIADAAGSACVKANGEHCHKASTGFQACWFPGETGEKVVGDVLQKKVAGTTEIPPNLNLPNGDTLVKQPPSITTTTTNTTTNKTTTTTTTNYITVNGTNPPGTQVGEPDDGSAPDEGGDGEGDPKSSTGGANCEESDKPLTEGDPILANLVEQAWRTRCAVESGNSVTTTGGEISDCKTPWTVSGPEKSVEVLKLKALRQSICGTAVTATGDIGDCAAPFTLDGSPTSPDYQKLKAMRVSMCGTQASDSYGTGEWLGEDGDNTGFGTADEGEAIGTDGLDTSGFGYGETCPTIPTFTVMGQSITIDTGPLCSIANMLGLLILILAALMSVRIMTSSN